MRRDIGEIIARVVATPGIDKVAMTTNGWNLHRHIADWHGAGSPTSISIDDLDAARFAAITGHDRLGEVVAGLDAALALGVPTVKVNAVLLRASAEDGFERFARFVKQRPIAVRFNRADADRDNVDYFAARTTSRASCWLRGSRRGAGKRDRAPSTMVRRSKYAHPDYRGRIGLIAPYGAGFCDSCNRLRVTARGKLRLCLFGTGGIDLRDLLISDEPDAVAERVVAALAGKSAGHRLHEGLPGDTRHLAQLGG